MDINLISVIKSKVSVSNAHFLKTLFQLKPSITLFEPREFNKLVNEFNQCAVF